MVSERSEFMNYEHYQEIKAEAKKHLSEGLSYGFASAVIWEMVDREAEEIDVNKICEISKSIVETVPNQITEQDRETLLSDLQEFERTIKAKVALLSADTDKVKSYVFESPRLPEMRGGSLILEELNESVEDILNNYNLPKDCIIYSSGGGILTFVPSFLVYKIKELIEKHYLEKTITATITVVSETFSYTQFCFGLDTSASEPAGFGELVDLMAYKLKRAKQEKKYMPFCETIPFTRHCDSCDIRPVSETIEIQGDLKYLCSSCYKKQKEGRGKERRGYLLEIINKKIPDIKKDFENCKPPEDLETIADISGDGYIGMVYADGNSIGKKIEELSSCEQYKRFSNDMLEATSTNICRTLAKTKFIDEERRYGVEMLCGLESDDVMAIVPGKYALQLAINMCKAFEKGMSSHGVLTMSAGVIIAPYNYPVYYLEEICEQLLKSAKKKSRKEDTAMIDFWAITSQEVMTSDLETYRKHLMEIKLYDDIMSDRLVLYERPYTLDRLQSLLDWIREFRKKGFSMSQLYGLRETLEEGRMQATLYYLYQLSRMSEKNRDLMKEFVEDWYFGDTKFFPWKKTEKEKVGYTVYSTPIVDLLEIYNLAEGVKDGSRNSNTD